MSAGKSTGLRFSGPNNSTLFTICCGTAVLDHQESCPRCGAEVFPKTGRFRAVFRDQERRDAAMLERLRQSRRPS